MNPAQLLVTVSGTSQSSQSDAWVLGNDDTTVSACAGNLTDNIIWH